MVTTRSSNLDQASSPPSPNLAESGVETNESQEEDYDSRPRKKQKFPPSRQKVQRIKGKLAGLMNMPIDIFSEITSHLEPSDLLRLARASKQLRSILMSKSSRVMWIEARKNVPSFEGCMFPDCPPDLSEPEYASLAFDKGCLGCNSSRSSRIDYAYRLRSCKTCSAQSFHARDAIGFDKACKLPGGVTEDLETIVNLVPRQYPSFFDINVHPVDTPLGVFGPGRFWVPNALQVYTQCMARKAHLTGNEYKEFLLERERMMPVVLQNCRDLQDWFGGYMRDQRRQTVNLKWERCKEIRDKLLGNGWDENDIPKKGDLDLSSFWDSTQNLKKWTGIVLQPKRLTEKIWSTVKPQLEAIVSYNQSKRLEKAERERRALSLVDLKQQRKTEVLAMYDAFVEEDSNPATIGLYPTAEEMLHRPCITGLLDEIDIETPLQLEAWHGILDQIRGDIREYQVKFRNIFANAVRHKLCIWTSQKMEPGDTPIAEDSDNTTFLSKDPSRITFTWKHHSYEGVTKPFPDILAREREWRTQFGSYIDWERAPIYATLNILITIDDYSKFDLVDGRWT